MNCPTTEAFFDDFVDGQLGEDERREFELHLASCRGCRAAVADRHALQRAVTDLPESIPPSRDLLPEVRETLRQRGHVPGTGVFATRPWLRWASAAAALLVVGTIGWMVGRGRGVPVIADSAAGSSAVPEVALVSRDAAANEFLDAEREYLEATARMLSLLEQRRDQLSPETARVLDDNLALINDAIEEVHRAFEADPGDPRHGHALTALYRKKIETLWRASRLSS